MEIKNIRGDLLLKNGIVVDPFKEKTYPADILIEKGRLIKISENIPEKGVKQVVDIKGLSVAPGFIDIHVHFREPGQEDAETIESGSRAALAGGFTQVCCMPNTNPAIDTESDIRYIYRQAATLPVAVYPIAAITKGRAGQELTEIVQLAKAGAVAFSDDGTPLSNSLILRYALEYSKIVKKPIINHAEDVDLRSSGLMNEGVVSTQLGLPGNPALAEEIMLARDLALARFSGAHLHVPHVTTAGAVDLIRHAKQQGTTVTAEATPHHFSLTDEYMRKFDANGKVAPPLRTEEDRQALIAGLKDGTLDAIASDHAPHTYNTKETSLDLASYGMIGLESAFGLGMTHLVHKGHLSVIELIKKLTVNPARIMHLSLPELRIAEKANLTIFDPDEWWIFSKKNIYSKSQNTPFIGTEMTGRVKGVLNESAYVTF